MEGGKQPRDPIEPNGAGPNAAMAGNETFSRSISRRKFFEYFFKGAALTAPAAYLIGWDTTNDIETSTIEVKLPPQAAALSGFRIGFISDIHLSLESAFLRLTEALATLRESKVDMIALGGDYVWLPEREYTRDLFGVSDWLKTYFGSKELSREAFTRLLVELLGQQVRDSFPDTPKIAVVGNHEQRIDQLACSEVLPGTGTQLLMNEYLVVNRGDARLVVSGTDDLWTGAPHLELPSLGANDFRVVLCHNPDFLSFLLKSQPKTFDLGLAGHTHAGQFKFPFIGALAANVRDTTFAEGLRFRNGQAVFTSRGLGVVGIPYRLNCPPEVSIINLVG
jgi:predicted MPP superfamily phosphohydrolase